MLPPSQSQVNILEEDQTVSFKESIKAMAKNKSYLWLIVAIGGSNGMYTCFGILINGVYLHYFPVSEF